MFARYEWQSSGVKQLPLGETGRSENRKETIEIQYGERKHKKLVVTSATLVVTGALPVVTRTLVVRKYKLLSWSGFHKVTVGALVPNSEPCYY